MSIEVVPAAPEQEPILANLLELYSHDFSEFIDLKLQPDGRYGYPLLSRYWTEEDRFPYLVRENGHLAGFALVTRGSWVSGRRDVWDMAEFFIVRSSRRRGVGVVVAHEIWRRHPGPWEVRVRESNGGAAAFWESAVCAFTSGRCEAAIVEEQGALWKVYAFQSTEGGEARRNPTTPGGNRMGDVRIRQARADDEMILWQMLTYAATMNAADEQAIAAAKADPTLRDYVQKWGRRGDLGIIAFEPDEACIGAAWVRLGGIGPKAFTVRDASTPELAMAVIPSRRNSGVGTRMLEKLLELCSHQFPAVALSVREENPAVRLYRRLGFQEVRSETNRVGGRSVVMRLDFPTYRSGR